MLITKLLHLLDNLVGGVLYIKYTAMIKVKHDCMLQRFTLTYFMPYFFKFSFVTCFQE